MKNWIYRVLGLKVEKNKDNYSFTGKIVVEEELYYLEQSLSKQVAELLVKELYQDFKDRIMTDKNFMKEVANEFRILLVKKTLE